MFLLPVRRSEGGEGSPKSFVDFLPDALQIFSGNCVSETARSGFVRNMGSSSGCSLFPTPESGNRASFAGGKVA
jgi:hypothetical protein